VRIRECDSRHGRAVATRVQQYNTSATCVPTKSMPRPVWWVHLCASRAHGSTAIEIGR
jgi:hypothetical protein